MSVRTDYLGEVFYEDRFQAMVPRTVALAEALQKKYQFDAIAFTGTSGSAIAYILGYMLNVKLICIRKDTENSHYRNWDSKEFRTLEGYLGARKYLIVDDFISSGNTVDRIMSVISQSFKDQLLESECDQLLESECVAMLMYDQSEPIKTYHSREKDKFQTPPDGIPVFSCNHKA